MSRIQILNVRRSQCDGLPRRGNVFEDALLQVITGHRLRDLFTAGFAAQFIVEEEKQTVLFEGSTERGPADISDQLRHRQSVLRVEEIICGSAAGAIEPPYVAVKIVGPALRYKRHLCSAGIAIRCVGVGRGYAEFLEGV